MSDLLARLLEDAGVAASAQRVGESMYRLKWGSATLITGAVGDGIVVIAPLFDRPPARDQERFFRRLLEINGEMGGTCALALQRDGSVVLQLGRGVKGLDAHEFGVMLGTVGRFADDYDDALRSEFYR
jgi:hypothetical protein